MKEYNLYTQIVQILNTIIPCHACVNGDKNSYEHPCRICGDNNCYFEFKKGELIKWAELIEDYIVNNFELD